VTHAVLVALVVTLVLEVPVVAALYPGQRVRMALVALAANLCTNLTLNVIFPSVPLVRGYHVLVGEIAAVLVEWAAYSAASRPRDVGRALAVSGLANALSYAVGPVAILALR
jgi:hypothetical protein